MAKAKEIAGLDCEATVLDDARAVLLERLDEMCQFRAAALDWSDIEGVHDMRVASRRLRSALNDFRPYLRGKIRERKLREAARALGCVRDEDVAIVALEKLASDAPEDVVAGINHLIDERKRRRDRARLTLEGVITETNLARLRDKLERRIMRATRSPVAETRVNEDDTDANQYNNANQDSRIVRESAASISFRRAGREIILERLEELKELSDSLYRPFKIEPLHEMRIAAKRLRYAMELFAQCWEERLAWFAEEVAHMQDSLGELHDCDDWLSDFGKRLARGTAGSKQANRTPEEVVAERSATFWLMENFSKERAKHYRKALERWHEWEQAGFGARLTEVLDAEPESLAPTNAEPNNAEQTTAEPVASEPESEPAAQVIEDAATPEIQNPVS